MIQINNKVKFNKIMKDNSLPQRQFQEVKSIYKLVQLCRLLLEVERRRHVLRILFCFKLNL